MASTDFYNGEASQDTIEVSPSHTEHVENEKPKIASRHNTQKWIKPGSS